MVLDVLQIDRVRIADPDLPEKKVTFECGCLIPMEPLAAATEEETETVNVYNVSSTFPGNSPRSRNHYSNLKNSSRSISTCILGNAVFCEIRKGLTRWVLTQVRQGDSNEMHLRSGLRPLA